jgi:hypothetical protein
MPPVPTKGWMTSSSKTASKCPRTDALSRRDRAGSDRRLLTASASTEAMRVQLVPPVFGRGWANW